MLLKAEASNIDKVVGPEICKVLEVCLCLNVRGTGEGGVGAGQGEYCLFCEPLLALRGRVTVN